MLEFSEQNYLKENDLIDPEPPFIPPLKKKPEKQLKPDGMKKLGLFSDQKFFYKSVKK